MSFFEDLGEKVMAGVHKVHYQLIGILISLLGATKKAPDYLERFSPYPIFEKRGVELKDYLVLKAQIFALGFLALAVLYIFDKLVSPIFFVLTVLFGIFAAASVSTLKDHFTDYDAYRTFFYSYIGISVVLFLVKRVKPTFNFGFPYLHFVVIALTYIALFSFFFRSRFSRDFTFGRVVDGGDPMTLKVNYDIAASIKPTTLVFKNDFNAKEGDVVKLAVSRGFLNLTGSRITAVIELVREN